MSDTTNCLQVATTLGSQEDAERVAQHLIDRRLAGCVQISGPIRSIYHWQGRIETEQEWLCTAKTTVDRYPALEAGIREVHSYDVPEILAVEVARGSADYLAWLREQVND